jgi:ABC-type histidine transport system ATPase subunit
MTQRMLDVQGLHAYYGKSHILQGVDVHVDALQGVPPWLRRSSGWSRLRGRCDFATKKF